MITAYVLLALWTGCALLWGSRERIDGAGFIAIAILAAVWPLTAVLRVVLMFRGDK